jgi:hypothetical protein
MSVDLAEGGETEEVAIGRREFATGLMKAIVRDPNGHVAEWILKELQIEAAKWKTEYTEAEHRAYYRYGREGVAQWEEPEILVELRRCAKLASGGEV